MLKKTHLNVDTCVQTSIISIYIISKEIPTCIQAKIFRHAPGRRKGAYRVACTSHQQAAHNRTKAILAKSRTRSA